MVDRINSKKLIKDGSLKLRDTSNGLKIMEKQQDLGSYFWQEANFFMWLIKFSMLWVRSYQNQRIGKLYRRIKIRYTRRQTKILNLYFR